MPTQSDRNELQPMVDELNQAGFVILKNAIANDVVDQLLSRFGELSTRDDGGIKNSRGETYASRNVLDTVPLSHHVWQQPQLIAFLTHTLGEEFGLVRGLFFDKHPNRTWSLGWHKDMTIAVKDNQLPSSHFSKPTRKSGIPHVVASEDILQNMVTLRIHLDRVTHDNGPLQVIPASHLDGNTGTNVAAAHATVLAEAGDVLAMKPLISHASGSSKPGTKMHRRILHLEFSGSKRLPDGYQWLNFIEPTSKRI